MFFLTGREHRAADIERVKAATDGERAKWCESLAQKISKAESLLTTKQEDLSRWFKMKDGRIDADQYMADARKQIDRDAAKACSLEFSQRYVSGVEFLRIPRFRSDTQWEDFALSFSSSLVQHLQKDRVINRMAQVCEKMSLIGPNDTAEEALAALRGTWAKTCEAVEDRLGAEE